MQNDPAFYNPMAIPGTQPSNSVRSVKSFTLEKLILQNTGTYEQAYSRPFISYANQHTINQLHSRIDSVGASRITPGLLSGLSLDIMAPTAQPSGEIYIPNGWDTPRLRFVLIAHCAFSTGAYLIYYLQGYTNYAGVVARPGTNKPALADDLEFTVNSFITVTKSQRVTPLGRVEDYKVYETAQVMADGSYQVTDAYHNKYLVRPQDVLMGLQYNYIQAGESVYGHTLFDGRSALRPDPMRSDRANNVPAIYLANMINGYVDSSRNLEVGDVSKDLMTGAIENVFEGALQDNVFFRQMAMVKGTSMFLNRFNASQLASIFPNLEQQSIYTAPGQVRSQVPIHQKGMTEHWAGSDRVTQVASLLGNVIPALMLENMITKIHIRSTNIEGPIITTLENVQSLTNADISPFFDRFIQRLNTEILNDITYNNAESLYLEMSVDLFGETWIDLSLGDSPRTPFVQPSFCDSLSSPLIIPTRPVFDSVVNNFEVLLNNVNEHIYENETHSYMNPVMAGF